MSDEPGAERTDGELGPYVPGSPVSPGRPRRRGGVVAIALGALVAMVAGVLALATLTSDGGSATPESAVRKLVDAAANEDVLGALEALVPAERAVLRDRVVDIAGELGRLGILDDELDLGHVPGADMAVDGLELRSEALSDEVAAVLVTGGRARLSLATKDLPLGPLLRRYVDNTGDGASSPPAADLADGDVRLVAVREGGDWFVSLAYSLAESIRRGAGQPVPAFDQALARRGETSPEAAVRELARAAAAFDARRLVELAAPGESAALHAYAPLFLDAVEAAAGGLRADGVKATVDELELSSTESGDEAAVTVDRLSLGITSEDGLGTFAYDGRCARYDAPDAPEVFKLCSDDPTLGSMSGAPIAGSSVTVVRRGGAWYVSPVGTYLDAMLITLRSLDLAEVERAVAEGGPGAIAPLSNPLLLGLFAGVGRGSREVPREVSGEVSGEWSPSCSYGGSPEETLVPCEELQPRPTNRPAPAPSDDAPGPPTPPLPPGTTTP